MLIKSKYLFFTPTLILGSIITISSSSWFSAWMGLEINLMSFAPMLINNMTFKSIEATIKYFIVQALASTMLIFFVFLPLKLNMLNLNMIIEILITMTLLLKAGVAPLHFWFPQVMYFSEWPQCIIILTWQKLAPFVLLSFFNNKMILFSVCISAIIGTLGAINQVSLKKILTYSSINHSAWMLLSISCNDLIWLMYFSSYIMMTFSVVFIFYKYNIDYLSALQMLKMNLVPKLLISINFLSLAGLPPLLGFMVKLMVFTIFIKLNFNVLILMLLLFSSFLALYFYLRIIYSSLFLDTSAHLIAHTTSTLKTNLPIYCIVSILGSIILPMMVLLT